MKILEVTFEINGGVFKIANDRFYGRCFGIFEPGQNPHWSWLQIDKSDLREDTIDFLKEKELYHTIKH